MTENALLEKSIITLELPQVLEMLAEEAVSMPAKERAAALRPGTGLWRIKEELAEATAAREMIILKGNPALGGVQDVGASLDRAARGAMLGMRELLRIAGVLRAARTVRAYAKGDREERGTRLDYLFHALRANKYLEERITNSILGDDELADSASTELASIRRRMRAAGAKVREILQKIITSPAYSKALQEPIITMRADRYVVPVKAEYKNAIPGLVHDISSSGATQFVEPMAVVEANNQIRELAAQEKAEIERVLFELSGEAAESKDDIQSDFETLVALDLIFAKARLSDRLGCAEPKVVEQGALVLRHARHPLLPRKEAVPIDISIGESFDTLVITGPNTGGKTVSIKTLGLLCLMTRCGLHIPVDDGSVVPIFDKILADIGDEQSIEQSLSTFSAHMTNIVEILKVCSENTLLLFDELGAGTDPVEGAALAISIIEYARSRGARIAATTHYAELKAYATTSPGVQNASCEFDVETLRPTYRLVTGIPGKSNAFAISRRLGMPEEIINDAGSRIGQESASFEEMIGKLEAQRQEMERERIETDQRLRAASENQTKAETLRREVEQIRTRALADARREAQEILEDARRVSDEITDEMKRLQKQSAKGTDWQRVNEARSTARRRLNEAEASLTDRSAAPEPVVNAREIREGDTVELLNLGTKAQVLSIQGDGTLNLQAGILKVSVSPAEVRLLEDETPEKVAVSSAAKLRQMGVSPEIDLRGMTGEEAVPMMERYLDGAMLSGLNTVTVIHGKGTGALRKAVQEALRRYKGIKGYRLGRFGEGEDGVTIVELK